MRDRVGLLTSISITPSELQRNELFATLTDGELSRIKVFCSEFSVIEDGILFSEGRDASYLYLVTEGQIALHKAIRAPHGRALRRTIVTVCRPGDGRRLVRPRGTKQVHAFGRGLGVEQVDSYRFEDAP